MNDMKQYMAAVRKDWELVETLQEKVADGKTSIFVQRLAAQANQWKLVEKLQEKVADGKTCPLVHTRAAIANQHEVVLTLLDKVSNKNGVLGELLAITSEKVHWGLFKELKAKSSHKERTLITDVMMDFESREKEEPISKMRRIALSPIGWSDTYGDKSWPISGIHARTSISNAGDAGSVIKSSPILSRVFISCYRHYFLKTSEIVINMRSTIINAFNINKLTDINGITWVAAKSLHDANLVRFAGFIIPTHLRTVDAFEKVKSDNKDSNSTPVNSDGSIVPAGDVTDMDVLSTLLNVIKMAEKLSPKESTPTSQIEEKENKKKRKNLVSGIKENRDKNFAALKQILDHQQLSGDIPTIETLDALRVQILPAAQEACISAFEKQGKSKKALDDDQKTVLNKFLKYISFDELSSMMVSFLKDISADNWTQLKSNIESIFKNGENQEAKKRVLSLIRQRQFEQQLSDFIPEYAREKSWFNSPSEDKPCKRLILTCGTSLDGLKLIQDALKTLGVNESDYMLYLRSEGGYAQNILDALSINDSPEDNNDVINQLELGWALLQCLMKHECDNTRVVTTPKAAIEFIPSLSKKATLVLSGHGTRKNVTFGEQKLGTKKETEDFVTPLLRADTNKNIDHMLLLACITGKIHDDKRANIHWKYDHKTVKNRGILVGRHSQIFQTGENDESPASRMHAVISKMERKDIAFTFSEFPINPSSRITKGFAGAPDNAGPIDQHKKPEWYEKGQPSLDFYTPQDVTKSMTILFRPEHRKNKTQEAWRKKLLPPEQLENLSNVLCNRNNNRYNK